LEDELGRAEWTFILRRGVRFHNGKEMTSEDVVASLKRWREVSGPTCSRG
jgi:MarR-like DNA-binding transcriptional regulator SgrR of sgrS sRNA